MKKRIVHGILGALAIIALLFVPPILYLRQQLHGWAPSTNYDQAAAASLSLFKKRRDDFVSAANTAIANQSSKDIQLRGVKSVRYDDDPPAEEHVSFYIDGQGIAGGGIYWGLYYVPTDVPVEWGGEQLEEVENGRYCSHSGSHFYFTEKWEDGWYFYYHDYERGEFKPDWVNG